MRRAGVKNAGDLAKTPGHMTTTVYDEVRYSNFPYAQTHPERLATVAILHGLTAPDPFRARVLEIGCGAGGNLMAMTAATPGIQALGVDLAPSAIEEGNAAIAAIGLTNLQLRQGDVRALTQGQLGEFDYIVAHGVYAWIPADARDALLELIASHLAPDGLAYVSYNANPGGYLRRMLRDAGLWHARGLEDPLERAAKAQELYMFLRDNRAGEGDMYGQMIERLVPALAGGPLYRLPPRPPEGAGGRPAVPARARRPERLLGAGVVRRLRRARRSPSARLRRRGRSQRPAQRADAGRA